MKDVSTIRDDRNLILFDLNQDIMVINIIYLIPTLKTLKSFKYTHYKKTKGHI